MHARTPKCILEYCKCLTAEKKKILLRMNIHIYIIVMIVKALLLLFIMHLYNTIYHLIKSCSSYKAGSNVYETNA